MIIQIRVELLKLVRSKGFYLSFAALSAFVSLMLWGFYSYAEQKTSGQATEQFKYTYESKSYFNGLTFTLYSLVFAFSLVIPIFVAMSAGGQIAGERRAGTLRMICIRPVSRVSIVLSKFFVVAIHAYLLMAFFIALNLLVGLLFVGWGNLELYPGPLNLVDAPGQILRDDALWRFFLASFSGTWALSWKRRPSMKTFPAGTTFGFWPRCLAAPIVKESRRRSPWWICSIALTIRFAPTPTECDNGSA